MERLIIHNMPAIAIRSYYVRYYKTNKYEATRISY